jgi:hypothetical protein
MRKELTMQDIADLCAALDLAHDTADHGEPARVTFDKANRDEAGRTRNKHKM